MNLFDVFSPSAALDPTAFTGEVGANHLMQAAAHFPGGPTALIFALFWAPIGPGVPAGVLLAHHLRLAPTVTFGLYFLSDTLAAVVLNPLYAWLRTHGRRIPMVRKIGRRLLGVAMIGIGRPTVEEMRDGRRTPALFRVGTVGFGVDVYTAGALASALPVPRLQGWAAAIAGDILWFALLLGSSIAAATVLDDDRWIALVVVAVTLIVPPIARRVFPALRA